MLRREISFVSQVIREVSNGSRMDPSAGNGVSEELQISCLDFRYCQHHPAPFVNYQQNCNSTYGNYTAL